jgi:hypothetical protein
MSEPYKLATPQEISNARYIIQSYLSKSYNDPQGIIADYDKDPFEDNWYVRMHGISKEAITLWLILKQRSLFLECHFMPLPEVNKCQCYEYLLKKNNSLVGYKFSIGETAVYLISHIAISQISYQELDRLLGSAWSYTEAFFATAMEIGFKGKYRYRPKSIPVFWRQKQ